jgi:hypothetical protein
MNQPIVKSLQGWGREILRISVAESKLGKSTERIVDASSFA